MTAAQFIDQAKTALDEFGEIGLCESYQIGTIYEMVTPGTELAPSEWWRCFQQFCVQEGREIM